MSWHLLIIDDISSHSLFLQWMLNKEGYLAYIANSYEEATELLQKQEIHLILLDLMMPQKDGYEMLTFLKTHAVFRAIPVIIVSAKSDRESIEASLRKGAVDYVVKPYNSYDLKNKIAINLKRTMIY